MATFDSSSSSSSFDSVFRPLAQHFFPDGCPVVVVEPRRKDCSSPSAATRTAATIVITRVEDVHFPTAPPPHSSLSFGAVARMEAVHLQQVWPVSTSRTAVSAADAEQAMSNLQRLAVEKRWTGSELVAVAYIATTILLPIHRRAKRGDDPPLYCSPILAEKIKHFTCLVQSLLPRHEQVVARVSGSMKAAMNVVSFQLVSVCSGSLQFCTNTLSQSEELLKARRCVLQFLSLALQWAIIHTTPQDEVWSIPPFVLTTVVQWALHPVTCLDATRVLWYSFDLLPKYHMRHLTAFSKRCTTLTRTASIAIADLAQRNGGTQIVCKPRNWLSFPNSAWESNFIESSQSEHHRLLDRRLTKRSRRSYRSDIHSKVFIVQGVLRSRLGDFEQWRRTVGSLTNKQFASDFLTDEIFQYLTSVVHTHGHPKNTLCVENGLLRRFHKILPKKLHQEWYCAAVPPSSSIHLRQSIELSRLRLIRSLVQFAQCTGGLPVEAEVFVLQHILSCWDGNVVGELGRKLLMVLPFLQPPETNDDAQGLDHSLDQSHCESTIELLFLNLDRVCTGGTDRTQHSIVFSALSGILFRWGMLDKPNRAQTIANIVDVCRRTEVLLVKWFLACNDNSELLRAATVEFYNVACDVADDNGMVPYIPNPHIMYRLLLSPSVVHLDRGCRLLLRIRGNLQKQKMERIPLEMKDQMEQIRVFNCIVYDFCTALWTCTPFPFPRPDSNGPSCARIVSTLFSDLDTSLYRRLCGSSPIKGSECVIFPIASALSLCHNTVFSGYAHACWQEGNVSSSFSAVAVLQTVQENKKLRYLVFLKSHGLSGVHSFLSTFMESLNMGSASPIV